MQDWLSHRVRATPNRTALVRASTGETLDFANLDAMVDDLAGRLAALGVKRGDHLGMVMETRLAAVCTVHAAERLGAVLVPLGDGLTAVELADQLDAADVTTLVCSEETEATACEAFAGPVCSVDDPAHDTVASLAETAPERVVPAEWNLGDTRLLLFTSGTTGEPKAVRLTEGNLLWSAVSSAFRLGLHGDDRWLVCLSLHHMGGLSPVLRMPLYGTTVVLEESFDPGRTADNVGSYDVTCVSLVPTMLKRMLDLRGTLADSLRVVLLGGAPAPEDLLRRCRDFSVPVYPTYGMTETASQVATATPREAFDELGTVGRPLFWTSVTVRDGDRPVPQGEPGELVVDGPTVSPGYYGNPDATEAAFGPHGLRTGDVGYLDDEDRLFVLGRIDDQIITGGENVHPREITDVLRSHPMIGDAVVVGVPDDEWGELVGALVVPADDDLTVGDIEAYCRERLAGFKLPRVVSFVEELPRTASGTVEREAARTRLIEGMAGSGTERGLDVAIDADGEDALAAESETNDGAAQTNTDTDEREGSRTAESQSEDAPEVREAGGPTESSASATVGDGARDERDERDEHDDVAAHDDDTEPHEVAETFLIGGSDWSPGEHALPDRADEPEEVGRTEDDPVEEPETPDFVREVLPDDEPEASDERVDDERDDSDEAAEADGAADGRDDTDVDEGDDTSDTGNDRAN
ncbi:o-succinylbenzoate--CoA ligase [Salinigranum rubrum]|uniref:2-succinylbenzoate--CoA ligase n=1 Tax=Salinigranum rubrum TaxID=755307 RepID=A0A2I8VIF3_9EURY|nr:o-succinylbenzoate--CoA ligase [Salinigranum rubrum]AUV81717.1 o-succinylbenzoate--CoA ligase [Salinigranum rubrum]